MGQATVTTPEGVRVPRLIYGTAWKELDTERLTLQALRAGFVGIDTANQRKHYHEAGVGAALAAFLREGRVARDALFLQTKFTSRGGQDQRLPYDPNADLTTQVRQSFERSLEHLGADYLDSYVLHGPTSSRGLNDRDWEIWRAMEALAESKRARLLGVSNVDLAQLRELCVRARVPPRFVQNRCYARLGWDREVRAFCAANGMLYQGFSLLTANPHVTGSDEVRRLASARRVTPEQMVFAYALHLGMQPLTGTSSAAHLAEDLAALEITLEPSEVAVFERLR